MMQRIQALLVRLFVICAPCVLLLTISPPAHAEPALEHGYCDPGLTQTGLLCFDGCAAGYTNVMGQCLENCKKGTDIGISCVGGRDPYVRETYYPTCGNADGSARALCYPKCRDGYDGVGPVCWQKCKPGDDWGTGCGNVGYFDKSSRWPWNWKWRGKYFHFKDSYGRGAGWLPTACEKNTRMQQVATTVGGRTVNVNSMVSTDRLEAGLCHAAPRSGYKCVGAFCSDISVNPKNVYFNAPKDVIKACPNYPRNTIYPIVLVHGWQGFDATSFKVFGIDAKQATFLEYFNQIPRNMSSGSNGATVHVVAVPAVSSTEKRGDVLLEKVLEILKETGAKKVHLIGHSHGSPTSRYVAGKRPDLVASVTGVGGVNRGTPIATAAHAYATSGKHDPTLDKLVKLPGMTVDLAQSLLLALATGNGIQNSNSAESAASMTPERAKVFNSQYPAGIFDEQEVQTIEHPETKRKHKVLFYSWSGGQPFGNAGLTAAPLAILDEIFFPGQKSDGMVSVSSAKLGKYLGTYELDHLAETNFHTFGVLGHVPFGSVADKVWGNAVLDNIRPFLTPSMWFNKAHPISLYCEHAYRLKEAEIYHDLDERRGGQSWNQMVNSNKWLGLNKKTGAPLTPGTRY